MKKYLIILVVLGVLIALLLIPRAEASSKPLYGANVHPWYDWTNSVNYVASTPGMGIVRYDEYVPSTPVGDVVKNFDYVTSKGLVSDIVLIQPCCDVNITFGYVKALALAMGPFRTPIIEITNEPNDNTFGNAWPADQFSRALYSARNAVNQSGVHNLRISMGGIAFDDTTYLSASGVGNGGAWITDFGNGHFYTKGGNPSVGPLAPDDLDTARNGYFSMQAGMTNFQNIVGKPLVIGEWGWSTVDMPEGQRASYMRAAVSLARAHNVYALIVEEIGSGDGTGHNLMNTPSWTAFSQAATQ
jgi:hypothetical protein